MLMWCLYKAAILCPGVCRLGLHKTKVQISCKNDNAFFCLLANQIVAALWNLPFSEATVRCCVSEDSRGTETFLPLCTYTQPNCLVMPTQFQPIRWCIIWSALFACRGCEEVLCSEQLLIGESRLWRRNVCRLFSSVCRTIILKGCIPRKTVQRGEVGCLPHSLRDTH